MPEEQKNVNPGTERARKIVFFFVASIPIMVGILAVVYKYLQQNAAVVAVEIIAAFFILLTAANLTLNIISILSGKNLSLPLRTNLLLTRTLLPFSFLMGRVAFSRDVLHRSFISYSNKIVCAKNARFPGKDILVLLPRCIQNAECKNVIIQDISKCTSCGKCDVAEINKIISGTGIKAAVVTGGTQARSLLESLKPKAVIAIACERELVSGILDSSTDYVYGLINVRPNGPCFNTRAFMPDLKDTIESIIERRHGEGS